MTRRIATAALGLSAALALAGCASSATSGQGSFGATPTSHSTGSSSSSGSSSSPAASPATNGTQLNDIMRAGVASATSAHLALVERAGSATVTGSGDEKLDNGQVTAMNLTEMIPGTGTLTIVIVGTKTYAKVPASLNHSGKPWQLVTSTSTDPLIKQLAGSLGQARTTSSLNQYQILSSAASEVRPEGQATVAGTSTTHYHLVIATAKLPADYPNKAAIISAGVTQIPMDLYLDAQGRPVQAKEQVAVQGQSVNTNVTVTNYNQPVTITAPPASQVAG